MTATSFNPAQTHSPVALASRGFLLLVAVLIVIGGLSRLSPLFDFDARLFWQHMSEDGYLMQTIARNMAIGLGMSTAEGNLPTNGVQPLATFLFAGLHWLAGGSKAGGIAGVMAFSAAVALATLYTSYLLGRRVFGGVRYAHELALVAAALWFVAPRITAHSMNGLETGLYYLAITTTWTYYLAAAARENIGFSWAQRLTFGLLLGLTFLARNDAVFFIAALLLAHWLVGTSATGGGFRHRFVDSLVAGLMSIVVASPWLIHNKIRFGSIVPISGSAQSYNASLGQNLGRLPANWFEAAFPHFPIPSVLEANTAIVVASLVLTLISVLGFWRLIVASGNRTTQRFFVGGLIFTLGLSGYYGVFFGAPHFLSRYTSSLSPFLWLCTVGTLYVVLSRVFTRPRALGWAAAAVAVLLTVDGAFFAGLNYKRGTTHMHKQVVDWTLANVDPKQWVGAPQTGTLGYFHDRTLNLDGKVNPEALKVLLTDGHILNYVVDSKINYIVDWADMAYWVQMTDKSPRFAAEFEVVVHDKDQNLAALRRIRPVEAQ